MLSYHIHLIRNGSTSQPGEERQYIGQSNPSLSTSGIKTLKLLHSQKVYPYAQVLYTSPALRCTQTAQILYPNQEYIATPGLLDMSLGSFEGKTLSELEDNPDFRAWLENSQQNPPEGGETPADFNIRIIDCVNLIIRENMTKRITDIAIITHAGVIMTLMAGLALPRFPFHEWAVPNGHGYTLKTNTQLWMRSGVSELTKHLPLTRDEG